MHYVKIVVFNCAGLKRKTILKKMREMGIIDNIDELDYLKQVLSKNRFNEFICAVSAEVIYPI